MLVRILKRAFFFGKRYQCPICGSNLRKFLPFGFKFPVLREKNIVGGGYRLNALCPVCSSTDRERLLYLYLMNKTDIFSRKLKVLHIAPEANLSIELKTHTNLDYLTADLGSITAMVKMDITQISYPDSSFDVVICNHVLEHIIDDRAAMRELYRVMEPGGWGILQVPMSTSLEETFEDFSVTNPSEREIAFGQSDHVRIYAMDYLDRLKEAGFQVNQFDWIQDRAFASQNNHHGLLNNEILFVVYKDECIENQQD